MLTVKNGNDFEFTGRFSGRDYHFPVGKTVAIPDDAARHIFGVGKEDKTATLVRHGWLNTNVAMEAGMAILNNFSFNVADTLAPGEIIEPEKPAKPEKKTKQGSAPLQEGSGEEGELSDGGESESSQSASGGDILDVIKSGTSK